MVVSGSPTRPTASIPTTKATPLHQRSAPPSSTATIRRAATCAAVATDFVKPNGLAFCPMKSSSTSRHRRDHVKNGPAYRRFAVGRMAARSRVARSLRPAIRTLRRLPARCSRTSGRGRHGVHCYSPDGISSARSTFRVVANLCFGGPSATAVHRRDDVALRDLVRTQVRCGRKEATSAAPFTRFWCSPHHHSRVTVRRSRSSDRRSAAVTCRSGARYRVELDGRRVGGRCGNEGIPRPERTIASHERCLQASDEESHCDLSSSSAGHDYWRLFAPGAGYASFPATVPRHDVIELYSIAGNRCGKVTLPSAV